MMLNSILHSPDLIFNITPAGEFIALSNAVFPILGYDPKELTGKKFVNIISPSDHCPSVNGYMKIVANKSSDWLFSNFVHKNGTLVAMDWSVTWIEEHQSTFCIARRNSQSTKQQREQDTIGQFYKALVNNTSELLTVISEEGRYLFAGPSAKSILGFDPNEMIGMNALEMVHPDDSDRLQNILATFREQTTIYVPDFRLRKSNGEWIWLETLATNLLENEDIRAIVSTSRDITERKAKDIEIQKNELKYRSLFENNPDLVYYQDKDGYIQDVNDVHKSIFNNNREDIIGKHYSAFVHPATLELSEKYLEQALNGKPGKFEQTLFVPSIGITYYIDVSKIPVIVNGEVIGVHTVAKDITAEKQAQKIIQNQAKDLQILNDELKVQATNLEILNKRLKEEREKADQANIAKSTFLATMSHEIRTPMNGVLGMSSLLCATPLTAEQREYADVIKTSGEALLTVINDILDFSKIESGNIAIDPQNFNLRKCVEEVLDLFAARTAELKIDLIYDIHPSVPEQLVADNLRLRQVLLNLVGNAIKFTTQGEVFVGVTLKKQQDNEIELQFEVRDTGIGIPEDKISRLFRAFSQVDSSTTRKYGGTGLGLVISERLVQLMGGVIYVKSAVGVGTTFSFTIVCSKSTATESVLYSLDHSGYEGKKVLIVDDSRTNLKILQAQLEQWQLRAVSATSGSEALQALDKHKDFDLVITDMQMPGMNGVELASKIRRSHGTLPMMLLSSIGDETKGNSNNLFAAILTKPVKQQHLHNEIQLAFNRGSDKDRISKQSSQQILVEDFAESNPFRILIAEDNPINQKLIMRVLSLLGYSPSLAHNGKEALHMLQQENFDLVFMDVQMPEMDGLEATRRIRSDFDLQPLIIAMTANAMAEDRHTCLEAGMDDYISKPLVLEHLTKLLEKYTSKKRVA